MATTREHILPEGLPGGLTDRATQTRPAAKQRRPSWIWVAVVASRLVGIAAGAVGAGLFGRVHGWHTFDGQSLTEHLGSVGNVLAGSLVRWDSIHYLDIAAYGYRESYNTVFFPLYPGLIKAFGSVLQSNVIAGVFISLVSFGVAIVLLHRIATEELGPRAANATVLLLTFAPLSFFFAAVYTESLFLALTVGACYAARRERWVIACLCAAAAAITRVPGIAVVIPLAFIWWRSDARPRFVPAGLCLSPAALGAFLLYLHHKGDGLLAPLKNQDEFHAHSTGGTLNTLWLALKDAWHGLHKVFVFARPLRPNMVAPVSVPLQNVIMLVILIVAILALIQVFRKLPLGYGLYSTLVLIAITWSASKPVPLISIDRYSLTIFPLWIVAADWLARRHLLGIAVGLSSMAMCFYAIEFGRWAFVA